MALPYATVDQVYQILMKKLSSAGIEGNIKKEIDAISEQIANEIQPSVEQLGELTGETQEAVLYLQEKMESTIDIVDFYPIELSDTQHMFSATTLSASKIRLESAALFIAKLHSIPLKDEGSDDDEFAISTADIQSESTDTPMVTPEGEKDTVVYKMLNKNDEGEYFFIMDGKEFKIVFDSEYCRVYIDLIGEWKPAESESTSTIIRRW